MTDFDFDACVVGAGAVGLACGYALSERGFSVVVLEQERAIGQGVSSRNSEVVHGGLYYPTGSLKARLCVAGRRRLYAIGAIGIGVLTFPAFWLMQTQSPILVWIAIAIPFAFVYPAVYGPQAALFSELFDTRVRYTGTSFVYQFSGIFASGLTPIIATALLPLGDNKPWLICLYVLVVSIISALSVYAMTESNKRDMAVDNRAAKPA